jgi:asparagine synthase (glutamine-hydrolysing)
VPFLDVDFLDYVMALDPAQKMIDRKAGRIEKYILRKAFDTPEDPYLPQDILWRQKEQFSDGVGYGWIDALRSAAEAEVTDEMMAAAHYLFPLNTPATKEAYRYRAIFEELFPKPSAAETVPGGKSIACSTERAMRWNAGMCVVVCVCVCVCVCVRASDWCVGLTTISIPQEFAKRADCSGRSVAGVHEAAYDATFVAERPREAAQPPAKKGK